ncbi:hypothetical protein C8R44DRAFT_886823 [Mycena epipterygia]|nr:hypothetical protein C8R44DRAFT_886823 [Mycena epipterygia]
MPEHKADERERPTPIIGARITSREKASPEFRCSVQRTRTYNCLSKGHTRTHARRIRGRPLRTPVQDYAAPVFSAPAESPALTPPKQTELRGATIDLVPYPPDHVLPPSCRPPPPLYICIWVLLSAPSALVLQYKSRSNNALWRTDRERDLLGCSGHDAGRLGLGAVETWDGFQRRGRLFFARTGLSRLALYASDILLGDATIPLCRLSGASEGAGLR